METFQTLRKQAQPVKLNSELANLDSVPLNQLCRLETHKQNILKNLSEQEAVAKLRLLRCVSGARVGV